MISDHSKARRRTCKRPEFSLCYGCETIVVSSQVEMHHWPVPKELRGVHTIPLCVSCHDFADRINAEEWPIEAQIDGVVDCLRTVPLLVALFMEKSPAATNGGIGVELSRWIEDLRAGVQLPQRLSDLGLPEMVVVAIFDMGRHGRLLAMKMLRLLLLEEPEKLTAARLSHVIIELRPPANCLLLHWDNVDERLAK